jgi:hypothetical protein
MNRLIFISTLLFFTLSGFAQPNIVNINWGPLGTSDRYYYSTQKISADPVAPGNGVTWDFTNLNGPAHDSIIISGNGGNTSFSFDFSKANITFYRYYAPNKETILSHFRKTDLDFKYMGDALIGGGSYPYSYYKQMLKFPMAFNESFKAYYSSGGGNNGNVMVKYDGYGTLKLPGGTYKNVFRTSCKDSISPTKITYRYEWFDIDMRYMYMSVGTTTEITYINNRPKASGSISSGVLPMEVKVFPNPGSGQFTVSLPKAIIKGVMEITNIYGQVVLRKDIDNSSLGFELNDKGIYLVSVYSDGQKFFKKLLVD